MMDGVNENSRVARNIQRRNVWEEAKTSLGLQALRQAEAIRMRILLSPARMLGVAPVAHALSQSFMSYTPKEKK